MNCSIVNFKNSSVCQICLGNTTKLITTKTLDEKFNISILQKIHVCFQINISLENINSQLVCSTCIDEIDKAYKFRLKLETFIERLSNLSNLVKKDNSKIENNAQTLADDISKDNQDLNQNKKLELSEKRYEEKVMKRLSTANETPDNYTEGRNKFQCKICKKILKTKISLIKHNVSMHLKRKHLGPVTGSGTNRLYHCSKCVYSSPHSQTLVNHMRRHNGDRPYHCECGKAFTQSSGLTAHLKTHTNTTFYICAVCGKQFKHGFTLTKHQRVHESGKFSCHICKKYLKSTQSLKDHIHRHYNIRNYNCEDCGDTFVTSSELVNHRRKHSLTKIECHLCGYKTHIKKNLIIHLKRHAGDKSFKCEHCELSFYTRGELRRHSRVHTREKPYPCPTCGQHFTHSSNLNKHVLSTHGVEYKWSHSKMLDKANKAVSKSTGGSV